MCARRAQSLWAIIFAKRGIGWFDTEGEWIIISRAELNETLDVEFLINVYLMKTNVGNIVYIVEQVIGLFYQVVPQVQVV